MSKIIIDIKDPEDKAEALKHLYGPEFVNIITDVLQHIEVEQKRSLSSLELAVYAEIEQIIYACGLMKLIR
jgi:hypothetical protein